MQLGLQAPPLFTHCGLIGSQASFGSTVPSPQALAQLPLPSHFLAPFVPHGMPLGLLVEPHAPPLQVGVTQSLAALQSDGAKHATHSPFASHLPVLHAEPADFGTSRQAPLSHIPTEHSPLAVQAIMLMD